MSREYAARIFYKSEPLTTQRLDLVVNEKVIVEVKATERLALAVRRQLFDYLCATTFEVGLLLHFGPKGLGRFRLFQSNDRKPHGRLARPHVAQPTASSTQAQPSVPRLKSVSDDLPDRPGSPKKAQLHRD